MIPMTIPAVEKARQQSKRDAPVQEEEGAASFFGEGVALDATPAVLDEAALERLTEQAASAVPQGEFVLQGMTEEEIAKFDEDNLSSWEKRQREEAISVARELINTDREVAEEIAAPLTKEAREEGHREGKTTGSRWTVLKVSFLIILLALAVGYTLTRPAVTALFAPEKVIVQQGTDLGVAMLPAAPDGSE